MSVFKKLIPAMCMGISCLSLFAEDGDVNVANSADASSIDENNIDKYKDGFLFHEWLEEKLKGKKFLSNFSIGGVIEIDTVAAQQDEKKDDNVAVSSQGHIDLTYRDICSYGGYGAFVNFRTRSAITKSGSAIVEKGYLFWESEKFGTFRGGWVNSAADEFCIDGSDVLVGYQGFGNGYFTAAHTPTSGCIIDSGFFHDDGKAAKLWWKSPVVRGFSMGLSFTPNARKKNPFYTSTHRTDKDFSAGRTFETDSIWQENVITGGLAYEYGLPDKFNMKISLSGWHGKTKCLNGDWTVRNVQGYNIGVILSYNKFEMALGFTDLGKSALPSTYAEGDTLIYDKNTNYDVKDKHIGIKPGASAGQIYTAGISYNFGKLACSAGYLYGERKFSGSEKATSNVASFGVEYKFDKMWSSYIEYDHITTDTCDRIMVYDKAVDGKAIGNNTSNLYIVGTKVNI